MTVHRIYTEELEENPGRSRWECDCGTSGSAATDVVDLRSDHHIDHERGDRRIDVSNPH